MKHIKTLLFAALCSAWACTSDEGTMVNPSEEKGNQPEGLPAGWVTCKGEMNAAVGGYTENNAATRADGAITSTWADGTKIYLMIESGKTKVPVVAVYSNTFAEWSFSYDATQSIPATGTMVAHYFKDATTADFTGATLNENSVVYTDSVAQYSYDNGTFMVGIHMTPAYFRIRLAGVPSQQVTLSGMSRVTNYVVNTGVMEQEPVEIALTASSTAEDGRYYTPYVYGNFGENDSVYVELEDDNLYCRSLKDAVVTAGRSVWTSMPSANYIPKGWRLSDNFVALKTFTVNGVTFNMIGVKKGTFNMGSTTNSNEKPVHSVTLTKSYYIGETEVTQELYKAVMGTNPSYYTGNQRPVEQVSWNDCQTFISKLNTLTGKTFRLPTEAEWEFAARGGNDSKGYTYSGSNTVSDVAWYYSNCNSHYPVKSKSSNELGIYDMSGNVWEWCQDWYGSSYYSSSSSTDPTGPTSGSYRVFRGGSWRNGATDCRVAYRNNDTPTFTYNNIGFRLALSSSH